MKMKRVIVSFFACIAMMSLVAGPYEDSRKLGITAFNKGEYEYALKCFQSVLKIAPADNDLQAWIEKCQKKILSKKKAQHRVAIEEKKKALKKKDSYYIEKAKMYISQNEVSKAESTLEKVRDCGSVDYCLLMGDLLYLYKGGADGWRDYYLKAAAQGSEEGEIKSHSLLIDVCGHICSSHPKTKAGDLANKADSLTDNKKEERFHLTLESARLGYDLSKLNVARCYISGNGIARDYQIAFYWLQQISDRARYADGLLAWFYFNGVCVEKNHAKAYELLSQYTCCDGNNVTNNGLCNEFGMGTVVNKTKALQLYWQVIESEQSNDYYRVALERYCHLICIEQLKDTTQKSGEFLYRIALAMLQQSNSHYVSENDKRRYAQAALQYCNKAYEVGVKNKKEMGYFYKNVKVYDRAIELLEPYAANSGSVCHALGEIYENADCAFHDYRKAKEWYLKAKKLNHWNADTALKRIKRKGY